MKRGKELVACGQQPSLLQALKTSRYESRAGTGRRPVYMKAVPLWDGNLVLMGLLICPSPTPATLQAHAGGVHLP